MNASSPSGHAMPTGNLPGWKQIFTEDFNNDVPLGEFPGSVYGHKFTVYPDGTPDTIGQRGALSRYYPSKVVSVHSSLLNLHLHTEGRTHLGAAILPILPGNQLYGKYTICFRSDPVKGFKTAWLLWPLSENWPHDGEIDFPEGDLVGTIGGYIHHQYATSGSDQDAFNTTETYTNWHVASTEWTLNNVTFILDDKIIGTSNTRIPNTPMCWVIQTESCLTGRFMPTTTGNLQIDWVVAYTPVP